MLPRSIRARLLGLVVAAIVPFVALIGIGLLDQWHSEFVAANQRSLDEARLLAAQVDDQVGDIENLMAGLSRAISTDATDKTKNDALLRQVKGELPDFMNNVVVLSIDGSEIGMTGDRLGEPIHFNDRAYFQNVLKGSHLSISEAIHSRINGKWIVVFARPIKDQRDQLRAILAIGVQLDHFQNALRTDNLPDGSVVRVVNANGIVLAQSTGGPNWVGRDLSKNEIVARHIAAKEASDIVRWSDDVERITGSSTAHRVPWLVSVGIPSHFALAKITHRLGWGSLFSTFAIAIALMIAWMLSGRIVRPLRQLGKDASALASGELGHRSAIHTKDELGDLATSFNLMAESLETRHQEIMFSSDEVRQTKDALAALIENVPVPIVVKELEAFRFILVNRAYEAFLGISRDQILGKNAFELFPPADAATINEHDKRALQLDRRSLSGEFPVQTPNNGLRDVTTTRLVVHGADKKPYHLMAVIEDITERRKAESLILHMAHHDPLTDLLNRAQYYERLKLELGCVKRGEHLAVLCLDLDHFKDINDTHGHSIGDELLKNVTARLLNCIDKTDTIARLGGDEFAIIQTAVDQPMGAEKLAGRIQDAINVPIIIDGLHVATNVSIGISIARYNATTPIELMKQADMALYRAKAAGRNAFRFFEPEMAATMKARRGIESDLRSAIVNGELELHYQPVVSIQDNAVVGLEALARWRHPKLGLLAPAEFIPIAEETGLIIPLGEWVLRQACADAAKWPGRIKVAVNLSPAQIRERELTRVIITALAASGLSPRRLELEITEEMLLRDDDKTLALLQRLRELGVQIVLDDFGTGYSSLNYLRRFPLDKIKIDRSFIRDLSHENEVSMAIVRAVVQIATVLKVGTTAEGIETDEQLELVRAAGCIEMQGYLFSAPKPIEELLGPFPQSGGKAASAA
jgi:diguanylate cyclase (GGDEF)-like protein/PAS domain S-box-containing protein